jgi:hypothetical protein
MKKSVLIISILLITVLVLSVVRIYIANQVATSGVLLGKVEEEVTNYKTENIILAEKLYTASSLTNIDSEAEKLGFVEPKTDFVLNGQVPVAFKQ